jgi:hypothetical protein
MLVVSIHPDRVFCTYEETDDCSKLLADCGNYSIVGNDYSYSWLKNGEGSIVGVEFYPPSDSKVVLALSAMASTNPLVRTSPFCQVQFSQLHSGVSDENADFGDYYLVSNCNLILLFMFPTFTNTKPDFLID